MEVLRQDMQAVGVTAGWLGSSGMEPDYLLCRPLKGAAEKKKKYA